MPASQRILVTGATGFIGRHLVDRLIERGGALDLLVRPATVRREAARFEGWATRLAAKGGKLAVLAGDIAQPGLGVPKEAKPDYDHVFHLAADYHLATGMEASAAANVAGTQNLIDWLKAVGFTGVFHHTSSIAVAGDFQGIFTEAMLESGQRHPNPYLKTKYESERLVRASGLRWRVYRPSAVAGDSRTGEMDKVDGPYYLFPVIRRVQGLLPPWVPLAALGGDSLNIVPVDFVAAAMNYIAHQPGHDGKVFHLVDPDAPDITDTLDAFLKAAHAPRIRWKFKSHPNSPTGMVGKWLGTTASAKFMMRELCEEYRIPPEALDAMNLKVRFDAANTSAALAGSGIACPPLAAYADNLWHYWAQHLDPDRDKEKLRRDWMPGKRILITGSSSGVGESLALQCGALGAHVILVARRADLLEGIAQKIRDSGGQATVIAADCSSLEDCDRIIETTLKEAGAPDVLVLNAAKSIRRPLAQTFDRFHDFQRTMALNYFGALKLAMGFLPAMRERRRGQIIHSSTWGVLYPTPRFGAYLASKAALDTVLDSLVAEFLHEGISVTHVYLPWIRTAMVAPTKAFNDTKMLTPDQAAELILESMISRPPFMAPPQAYWTLLARIMMPRTSRRIINLMYRWYPNTPEEHPEFASERSLLRRFIKGSPI